MNQPPQCRNDRHIAQHTRLALAWADAASSFSYIQSLFTKKDCVCQSAKQLVKLISILDTIQAQRISQRVIGKSRENLHPVGIEI